MAVLVPCSDQKPYRESRSHAHGYLPALEGKSVDVWVVSEPMGVIPYEWSDDYPNTAYEFPPKHARGDVRDELVARIRRWSEKHGQKYDRVFLALPAHHMAMVCDASTGLDVNFYDASIGACRALGHCPQTHFRATSSAYVDYLRRSIDGARKVNPDECLEELIAASERWENIGIGEWWEPGDEPDPGDLVVDLYVSCEDKAPESEAKAKQWWKSTKKRLGKAFKKFLDEHWAGTNEGQMLLKAPGFDVGPPRWPGRVSVVERHDHDASVLVHLPTPPYTRSDLARLLWTLSQLDRAAPSIANLCVPRGRLLMQELPSRAEQLDAQRKAMAKLEAERLAEQAARARRSEVQRLKKGSYKLAPLVQRASGSWSAHVLHRNKAVATVFLDQDMRIRQASLARIGWLGKRPSYSAPREEIEMFHDMTFERGTLPEDAFARLVTRLEAIRRWRSGDPKTKQRTPSGKPAASRPIGQLEMYPRA